MKNILSYGPNLKRVTKFHVNILIIQLLWLFEFFDRNPTSAMFKMTAVPANFNFQVESIAEKMFSMTYTTIMRVWSIW